MDIHRRVAQFASIEIDTPVLMASFLTVATDYVAHLKTLKEGSDMDREHATANAFLDAVEAPHVWPVVQYMVKEFRHPITRYPEPETLFQHVVNQLQETKPPLLVLPTPDDYDRWERELFWRKVTASFDYLTFAWEHLGPTGHHARPQADARPEEVKEVSRQFREMAEGAMEDVDPDEIVEGVLVQESDSEPEDEPGADELDSEDG
ncbi:hypothetical protein A1O7_06962 [Cladophialophora yegresii CBS 114405]|uniref:Uncharacterized protein n=1 Tax=Cladophialophora yegresii CBS 114405 TaxID=1182544 RepID=W9VM72_9EURO|nr:uncharacterized protein A1O7_06962 [Cladophialophora yegresii CBS 114405]EXJ56618.1 hypothetical protein A1O7_06962 [Cladophialophora yegresii CBS 114405]